MSTGSDKFEREFEAFLAEEEARVAALYRKLPQPEPDARLDAAVKSMAHRALNPQLVATPRAAHARPPRLRWLTGLGAAAGVVLAAGIAFKLGPGLRPDRNEHGAPATDVISVRAIDEPPPAPPISPPAPLPGEPAAAGRPAPRATTPPPPPVAQAPGPVSALRDEAKKKAEAPPERSAAASSETMAAPAAPAVAGTANAFPGEAESRRQTSSSADAVERRETMAEGAWQNLHDRDTTGERKPAAERAQRFDAQTAPRPAAGVAAPAPPLRELDKAAAAHETERGGAPAAAPAVPAAGGAVQAQAAASDAAALPRANDAAKLSNAPRSKDPNARLYPEHWLANIRTLLREQRRDEALRSLAEFRRLYPDYRLPDDLRDLK